MDINARDVLYHAAALAIRATETSSSTASATSSTSTATSSSSADSATRPPVYKIVGICLAVCSGLFIGVSFVLKKVGLLKANVKYNEEAGEGYGYLKNAYWWTGMTLMILGEVCNFVAYAFTDAILVTPLGALSVVITTILSAIFLKERLSFVGKVGCFICIVGSVIIPLNAPEQSAVANIQEMQHYVIQPGFLSYAGVILVGCAFTAWWVAPRYGKKSMLVYLSICSLIGGLSVVCTQGLGSAILAQINGEAQFNKWFMYVLLVFVVGTLLTEIIYLNVSLQYIRPSGVQLTCQQKALNLFNAALVTPTYYVYFTTSTIVTSAVLFQGFHGTVTQIVDVVLGFLTICSGVVLLQLAKSSKDVPDTAVLSGDLDQVRTVAEQEEPEYEPRADTIRGGAGIVRAMSKIRTKREVEEVKRIHEEHMEPIGENEEVEWDGLRRRKTVSSAGRSAAGSITRRRNEHPPLGMSHFPSEEDDISEPDSEVHPGFFGRIGRKTVPSKSQRSSKSSRPGTSPVPLASVEPLRMKTADESDDQRHSAEHVYGLPADLKHHDEHEGQDTEYRGASAAPRIHFAGDSRDRADSRASSLGPPPPPPHVQPTATGGDKRQFSFQDFIHRHKNVDPHADDNRPVSRGALSFASRRSSIGRSIREYPTGGQTTEEERLGLVAGDGSRSTLPRYSELEDAAEGRRSSDECQVTSGQSSSPEMVGGDLGRQRTRDQYSDFEEELYDEPLRSPVTRDEQDGRPGSGRSGPAFV
ncbi:Magnesium transporter NIPA [Teratosphaeria destructans]|uniref:Magnesium transporter NIPA n=1 Tax=Teratosphaeria destructans TaxID=418781 RepID=A0A9W7SYH5_9PEZI|nr:Magnesium transporter NIPA [Teratosphaeria destructans]